jgi:CHAT domain-containing protein
MPGEGVLGMPYALFAAGNLNTLLTLWPIDDQATTEFVSRFFGRIAAGDAPARALVGAALLGGLCAVWALSGECGYCTETVVA